GFVVSDRWSLIVKRLLTTVSEIENPVHIAYFAIHRASFSFNTEIISNEQKQSLVDDYLKRLESHPELVGLSENLTLPGTFVNVNHVNYFRNLANGIGYYTQIKNKLGLKNKLNTIIEIGSGWGRLARIFHNLNKVDTYILVDLPESLLFAFSYLKVDEVEASIKFIHNSDDLLNCDFKQFDFVLCPVHFFNQIKNIEVDLIINTFSFGEMQQGAVDYFFNIIETNIKPKYLFSWNTIFLDRNKHHEAVLSYGKKDANLISLNVGPYWQPKSFELSTTEISGLDNKKTYRNSAIVLLEWVNNSRENLIDIFKNKANQLVYGSELWIIYNFLIALWSDNESDLETFKSGLEYWMVENSVTVKEEFNFNNIGEIQYLNDRYAQVKTNLTI
ncbi:MAG: putative sugar O-methyltransferase, partial [Gammaproteobacteria bacterium]|nr:putative sugar O-methyltransferase [Gammaproteobacteria bacterium]